MLSGAALQQLLAMPPTRPRRGVWFRASVTQHVVDPLGKHRPIGRNRFDVAHGARVLYCAEDPATCLYELQAFAWPPQAISIVPVEAQRQSVLDLTDANVLAALELTPAEVAFNFRAMPQLAPPTATQRLGEALAHRRTVDGVVWHSLAVPAGSPLRPSLGIIEAGVAALGSSVGADDPLNHVTHSLP